MSGRSFLAALEEKYEDSDVSTSSELFVLMNMDVAGVSGRLRVPKEMSLHRCNVTHAGDLTKIADICSQISTLDLTHNNITDWSEVFKLLCCMPNVTFVNLSENRLGEFTSPERDDSYPGITKLALNSTAVSMDTVSRLLSILPSVEELHLGMNEYTKMDCPVSHPQVRSLFLNGNKISEFQEILKVNCAFPNLQQLFLINNPICELPGREGLASAFTCLRCINVSESNISSWTELEKFKHFPTLTDIRIKILPLYQDLEEKLRRQLIIGYLPNITRLNLSDITGSERETAERMFIRHYLNHENKPERFKELQQKHGNVEQFADIELKPDFKRTVEVHFQDKITIKVINISKTVGELKKRLAQEVAGVESRQVYLYYQDAIGWTKKLTVMPKLLYTLKIEDGDKFFIDLKYNQ